MRTHSEAATLVGKFLNEPRLQERIKLATAAINDRTPDDALSLLASALSIAVDQLGAGLEVAVESSSLSRELFMEQLQQKFDRRSADYLDHQFWAVVEPHQTDH